MRIGIIQMRLTSEINKNLSKILSRIRDARRSKIDLLCFPECALSGYIVDHRKVRWEQIRNGIGELQRASNSYGISLVVGTSWRSDNRIYNSALIIRPNTSLLTYYKNNLTEYDKKYFARGKSTLAFEINGIKCGVLICRDQNNPLLAMRYRRHAKILFYLSSHYYSKEEAIEKERKNKAFPIVRALENKIYIAKADAVGKHNGLVSIGGSIVVNPDGHVVAEAKKGKEEILKFQL
ncbi:MAG: carbon-nitrogen hydrolase family protein [Nitrososphaeraceae archaeon]